MGASIQSQCLPGTVEKVPVIWSPSSTPKHGPLHPAPNTTAPAGSGVEGAWAGTNVSFPTWDTAVDTFARQILISLSCLPCPCKPRKEVTQSVSQVIPQSPVLGSLFVCLPHPTCSKQQASTRSPLNSIMSLMISFQMRKLRLREGKRLAQGPTAGTRWGWSHTLDHGGLTPSVAARTQPIAQGLGPVPPPGFLNSSQALGQVLGTEK